MFLFGGNNSNVQIKGKRGHGGGGGGWGGQQQGGGWGGQQQGGGWGGQQQGGGWGGQQQGGGWGQQQQGGGGWGGQQGGGGWGGQQGGGGWGGQQQGGGWGGQQQGGGWGQQQQGGGWGQQQQGGGGWGGQQQGGGMGFIGGQNFWGNNLQGHDWVDEQRKRNDFNIFQPGQQQLNINDIIGKQIILLQPSPSRQRLQQLQQTGEPFLDQTFPPQQNSLSGQYGPQNHWSSISWQKVSDIMENPEIFSGKIEPGDIKQGYLGDCYFLAGLAALAERPDRIFNLFLLQQMNSIKYFSVKLLYKGKWRTIDMDEYIPCMHNKPAFSKSVGAQLWVVLLEKAWAKLYTSYKRIEAGYAEEAIHDLTGAPIKHLYFQHSSFNYEEDWNYLVQASIKQYSMVGSTQPGSDTNKSTSGVVQGHAYTILNATSLRDHNGQEHRVVQCRNPWGKGEFSGRWSDGDESWNYVPEEQKQRVGYNPDKDDGIFFMPYDDFITEFRALTIAQIDDDASYVYKSFKDPSCQGAYFKVEIFKSGSYSFLLDKTPERIYPDNVQNMYKYPLAFLQVGKLDGGVEKYQAFQSRRRTLCHRHDLQQGVYIVYARIDFDSDFEDQFEVNLAVYASTACNITLASNEEAIAFSGDGNVQWSGHEQQEQQWGGGGNDGW